MADRKPNIYPFMRFTDADAAIDWLSRAFGFRRHEVYRDDDGAVHHAEMSLGPGIVMFGQGDPDSQGVYVAVEDADAHYHQAKAAGCQGDHRDDAGRTTTAARPSASTGRSSRPSGTSTT